MNRKMLVLVAIVSFAARNSLADSLNITEENESLTVTLSTAGGTVPVNAQITPLTGGDLADLFDEFGVDAKEAWFVTLPQDSLVRFQEEAVGPFRFDEPESAEEFNFATAFGPTTLLFASDATQGIFQLGFSPQVVGFGPNPFVVENGASFDDDPIDLILADIARAPDAGSTMALMGFGVSALLALRRNVRA